MRLSGYDSGIINYELIINIFTICLVNTVFFVLFFQERRTRWIRPWLIWLIADTQPFNIVEDQVFRKFVKELKPNYVLPTRKVCM